jgi:hypothetical protein
MRSMFDPRQIAEYAGVIVNAAMPDDGVEPSQAEIRPVRVFDLYQDPVLSIDCHESYSLDEAFERHVSLSITIRRRGGESVFHAFDYTYPDSHRSTLLDVTAYRPGPWCEHLETLGQRAKAVLHTRHPEPLW